MPTPASAAAYRVGEIVEVTSDGETGMFGTASATATWHRASVESAELSSWGTTADSPFSGQVWLYRFNVPGNRETAWRWHRKLVLPIKRAPETSGPASSPGGDLFSGGSAAHSGGNLFGGSSTGGLFQTPPRAGGLFSRGPEHTPPLFGSARDAPSSGEGRPSGPASTPGGGLFSGGSAARSGENLFGGASTGGIFQTPPRAGGLGIDRLRPRGIWFLLAVARSLWLVCRLLLTVARSLAMCDFGYSWPLQEVSHAWKTGEMSLEALMISGALDHCKKSFN